MKTSSWDRTGTVALPGRIAVIDVETTGLFPWRSDRVVEIAAVVVGTNGRIEREFVSLVNPARDIGASRVHGLTSEDILPAPQFGDIAAHLVDALGGSIALAGHNVRFDIQFLQSEFSRLGVSFPDCFTLCTMELGRRGNLADCCREFGVDIEGQAHHALTDARATSHLLVRLLENRHGTIDDLRTLQPVQWPAVARSVKQPLTRGESQSRRGEPPTFLQRLLSRIHDQDQQPAADGAVLAYWSLLDRVLEDRHVAEPEADALLEMAVRWGLDGAQIHQIHRGYLNQLVIAAVSDGTVTDTERRDLSAVMRLLGCEQPSLDQLLKEGATHVAQHQFHALDGKSAATSLVGKSVCFTGELQCCRHGRPISREGAELLATEAGLVVVDSVTKKLDLLVVADPHTQSGKAKKARQYGVRILHEPVFWKSIGVNVQ